MSGTIYIQNRSNSGEVLQLLNLDGIHVMATLQPGQFVEVKAKEGTALTPFIVKQEVKNN